MPKGVPKQNKSTQTNHGVNAHSVGIKKNNKPMVPKVVAKVIDCKDEPLEDIESQMLTPMLDLCILVNFDAKENLSSIVHERFGSIAGFSDMCAFSKNGVSCSKSSKRVEIWCNNGYIKLKNGKVKNMKNIVLIENDGGKET